MMCYNGCGIKVHRVNGVIVKIEGNPDCPRSRGKLCAKGNAGIMALYSPSRLKTPLKRTNPEKGIGVDPKWVEIDWEEALDTIAEKLKEVREDDPRKLILESFDHDILTTMIPAFGAAFGTPNLLAGGASFHCGSAIHPVSGLLQGAFHVEPDLHYCNHLILFGSQLGHLLGESAVLVAQEMSDAKARGMKLIVVDPVCNQAAAKADEWIPIRPGTDGALALAMLNILLNEVAIYDAEFIKKYTNGPYLIGADGHYFRDESSKKPLIWDPVDEKAKTYDDANIKNFAIEGNYKVNDTSCKPAFQLLKEHVSNYTPEETAEITTIPAKTIRRITREFAEASSIGKTIVVDGKELPYRPACTHGRRGINNTKYSFQTNVAIAFLNVMVGSIDVPGGSLNMNGVLLPNNNINLSWSPIESPDGMVVVGQKYSYPGPYPGQEVKPPESVELRDLFPVASVLDPVSPAVMLEPERFKFPYSPEVLLHCRTNFIMTSVNPEMVAKWVKNIPFQVSFVFDLDETAEFADIVLPDTHYLERFDLCAGSQLGETGVGPGDWCYQMRQPVVEPPPNARNWLEVLFTLADRASFLKDFYHFINILLELKEPYKLELDKKYSWEEILDIWAKSWFGSEHDMAWFKEHSFIKWPRKVEEIYPRIFIKARLPIYIENFIDKGEEVKRMTNKLGIPWDISGYQPLVDWKPPVAYEEQSPEFDLFIVNYKIPFHTWSHTTNNVWLNELGEYDPFAYYIRINKLTAKKKGLKDGDRVTLETADDNRVEGWIKLTDAIHPEVIGIAGCFGHWATGLPIAQARGVHYEKLFPNSVEQLLNRIDWITSGVDWILKVKISKVTEKYS